MTSPYTEYTLRHWEEPDAPVQKIVAGNGIVSITPEALHRLLKLFFPIGYQEGEITVDVTVEALEKFWRSLGGEMERV